jgi:hypothetical protein
MSDSPVAARTQKDWAKALGDAIKPSPIGKMFGMGKKSMPCREVPEHPDVFFKREPQEWLRIVLVKDNTIAALQAELEEKNAKIQELQRLATQMASDMTRVHELVASLKAGAGPSA